MALVEGRVYPVQPTDTASAPVWYKGVKDAKSGKIVAKALD